MKRDDLTAMVAQAMPIRGRRGRVGVSMDSNWISVGATLRRKRESDPVRGLLSQSAWPGGVKLHPRSSGCRLHAQIPNHADTAMAQDWLRRQAGIVYGGLCAALGDAGQAAQTGGNGSRPFDSALLAERCTAGGWRATVHSDSEVRIEFHSRTAHRAISLTHRDDALRAAVNLYLGALAERAPNSHRALATFLLRATHSLQWARAFATGSDSKLESAGFECLLAPTGDDRPLILALDALATACELFGREAEMLAEDAALGAHYLALDLADAKNDPGQPKFWPIRFHPSARLHRVLST
jgi:hypothetical protein